MRQHHMVVLLVAVTLIAVAAATCTNGNTDGGSGCFCYDGYSGATCATPIAALSSCSFSTSSDTTTPTAPTLGGGINGDNFEIIVNFYPLFATRYVSKIMFLDTTTSFDYSATSTTWAITGATSCTEVYTATMDKTAAKTAGVFTVDTSVSNLETYSGMVYITAIEKLASGDTRTINYRLPYKYSFPVETATTVSAARVTSDISVTATISEVTLITTADDGTITVEVTIGTKYPYILDFYNNIGLPAGKSDVTSTPSYTVASEGVTGSCSADTSDELCMQVFTFKITPTISPPSACTADGTYVINAAVAKCVGDTTTPCIQKSDGTLDEKDVQVSLSLAFGNLCGPSTTFAVATGPYNLVINSDAARTEQKTRFVENVDTVLYFSYQFVKASGSPGVLGLVELATTDGVQVKCTTCTDHTSYADATTVNRETTTTPGLLLFNLPITDFLPETATATSYEFQWDIEATATIYFSTSKREVVQIRASGSSIGSLTSAQFSVVTANATDSNTISSSETDSTPSPTPDSTPSPTPDPTSAPASVVIVTEASEGLGLVGIIGIVVGCVCFTVILVVVLVLVARRKKGKKEQLSEDETEGDNKL